MRIKRALAIRDEITRRYRDLFSSAESCGMPHATMLDRRAAIWSKYPPATVPHWVKAYADGIWDQLQTDAYRHSLVYGGMVNGAFYSTHRDRPDYYEAHGIAPSDYADDGRVVARGHYWSRSLKPFFVG